MTDTKMLRERLSESGYKLRYIAEQIGITYAGFLKKINNETEFKASEIKAICDLIGIDAEDREKIFFAENVGK